MSKSPLLIITLLAGLISIILIFSSCTRKTEQVIQSKSITEIIRQEMGRKVVQTLSDDGKHILCVKQESSLITAFMVISDTGDLIMPKKKVRGTVAWHTARSIEVTIIPGVIDKRSDQLEIKKTIIPLYEDREAI